MASVFPDPFVNAGDDVWWFHNFFAGRYDDRTDSDLKVSTEHAVDNQAMRKVVDGDAIALVGEGGGESDGFDLAVYLRILLKLH